MLKEIKNAFGRTFYRIEYREELNVIEAQWYGFATVQDLKHAVNAGLEVHEKNNCPFRLNDNTDFSGPWTDAVSWLEHEWLPRAYKAGIRYLAHVARASSFGEEAGEALLSSRIGSSIEVRLFTDKEAAMNWLKAKQILVQQTIA